MLIKNEEIPSVVSDFWSFKFPGVLLNACFCLNNDFEDSDKWAAAVFKCIAEDNNELYIAVQEQKGSVIARELSIEELAFLTTGILPD